MKKQNRNFNQPRKPAGSPAHGGGQYDFKTGQSTAVPPSPNQGERRSGPTDKQVCEQAEAILYAKHLAPTGAKVRIRRGALCFEAGDPDGRLRVPVEVPAYAIADGVKASTLVHAVRERATDPDTMAAMSEGGDVAKGWRDLRGYLRADGPTSLSGRVSAPPQGWKRSTPKGEGLENREQEDAAKAKVADVIEGDRIPASSHMYVHKGHVRFGLWDGNSLYIPVDVDNSEGGPTRQNVWDSARRSLLDENTIRQIQTFPPSERRGYWRLARRMGVGRQAWREWVDMNTTPSEPAVENGEPARAAQRVPEPQNMPSEGKNRTAEASSPRVRETNRVREDRPSEGRYSRSEDRGNQQDYQRPHHFRHLMRILGVALMTGLWLSRRFAGVIRAVLRM